MTYRDILNELTRIAPGMQVIETRPANSEPSSEGPPRGPLSGHRLFDDLKWTPKYDLAAGIADYLQWRRDHSFVD